MMANSLELKEYSARHGLLREAKNLDKAQLVAEDKYRSLVGRELLFNEINDIQNLLRELYHWKFGSQHQAS